MADRRRTPTRSAATTSLNEGGGGFVEYDGRRVYCLGCAEKGVFRFTLHTDGVAAHGSMPRLGDNALLKLGAAPRALRRAPAVATA